MSSEEIEHRRMLNKKQIPFAEGLFTWPSEDEGPHLIGTKDNSTGHFTFHALKRVGDEEAARYENVFQLRGEAGPRQIRNNPKVAFSQVSVAPCLSACTIMTN